MKESYTLKEMLDSCGFYLQHEKPVLTWDRITMKDLYILMIELVDANAISLDIASLWNKYDERTPSYDIDKEEEIGELWYDKSSFSDMDYDEFQEFIEPDVNNIFEFETYLSYGITKIVLYDEIHPTEYIDSYHVVAYGSKVINQTWIDSIKQIHQKYFQ
jgi:hypothetical protein